MTPARRTPLTLLAALLLGVALGLVVVGEKPMLSSSVPDAEVGAVYDTSGTPPPAPRAGGSSTAVRLPAESTSAAYAAAWELIQDREMSGSARGELQCALLKEWCLVDLRAALRAAFQEERPVPDDPFADSYDPFAPSRFEACSDGMEQQLDLVWELIESREYGLQTRKLREEWISLVGHQNPLKLLDHFLMLPAEPLNGGLDPREEAVRLAMHQSLYKNADPKLVDAVMAKLVEFAALGDREQIISNAAMAFPMMLPEERHLDLLRSATTPVAREIYLKGYIVHLCRVAERDHELPNLVPAEYRAEVRTLLRLPDPASKD